MAFVKDMLRMWAHSWKRFISIAMITLLGVAVLTGIYAGCRDAFRSTDRFFDAQGLHDVQVLSTAGLSNGDIAALRKVNGVAKVQAERSQEVTFDLDGRKSATMQEIGTNGIDQPYLQEGRMPKKAGEIAVTRKFIRDSGKRIGSRLTVIPESASSDTSDTNDTNGADGTNETNGTDEAPSFPTKLTIVGVVLDPQNLSNPDGYSAMTSFRSTATTDYTFFAPSDGVTGTLYTSATLLVKGAAAESTFDESYENTVKQVTDRIDGTVKTDRQKARRQELLDAGNKKIADARAEADKKFADAQSQIDANRQQFNQQVDQIVSMQAGAAAAGAAANGANAGAAAAAGATTPQLDETTRETMRETIIAASPELTQAKQQLDQAQSQLNEQKASTEHTLKTKENELKTSIPQVRWYVQDRQSLGGFSALKSDLDSIQSLGNAFPIVFLLVAVMMSLTAMARMVEEDRSLIGTYVGLGYGRLAVASRYLLFALLACLVGGGIGLLVGFLGIPAFLMVVIEGLYILPGVRLEYDWLYGSAGIVLFVVGVGVVTALACREEIRHTPAALMRPKAPKAGARILLERIRPVWSRLNFLGKVTARNIFRFKSRLIMTVGGVAGCTALIICGFAINDTVDTTGVKQYEQIYQYDLMVVANDDDAAAMRKQVAQDGRATETLNLRVDSGEMSNAAQESETVQLMTVPNNSLNKLNDMVTLEEAGDDGWFELPNIFGKAGGGTVALDDSGVIVAKSAANSLDIHAGDTVTLSNGGSGRAKVKVAAVTRNLIGSDVYISERLYDQKFAADGVTSSASGDGTASTLTWNAMLAKLKGSETEQAEYADRLGEESSVLKAVSCAHLAATFKFDLMGAVVALIVGLAGGLALVVLFTLANTNVSERIREMATLKVLGFYDREVHNYVNREMMILTGMGVVVGLPLGRWIGGLLTAALNMPSLYFEVEVHWYSYAIAVVATLAFALLVQLFTNPVLDRVDPVSSLKSVE